MKYEELPIHLLENKDCAVRAFAAAFDDSYEDSRYLCEVWFSRKIQEGTVVREDELKGYAKSRGYEVKQIRYDMPSWPVLANIILAQNGNGYYSGHENDDPETIYLVRIPQHIFCVKGGKVINDFMTPEVNEPVAALYKIVPDTSESARTKEEVVIPIRHKLFSSPRETAMLKSQPQENKEQVYRELWQLPQRPRSVQVEAMFQAYSEPSIFDYYEVPRSARLPKDELKAETDTLNWFIPRSWCHFLDMRLGKTLLTINEALFLKQHFPIDRVVVISPKSFVMDWVKEVQHATENIPSSRCHVKKEDNCWKIAFVSDKFDVLQFVILNHDGMTAKAASALLEQVVTDSSMIILDESASIKDHTTKRADALKKLVKENDVPLIRFLSGLPAPEGPQGYWSQLSVMHNEFFEDDSVEEEKAGVIGFSGFKEMFTHPRGRRSRAVGSVKNARYLAALLSNTAFFATRSEWGDFKAPHNTFHEVEMLPEQKEAFTRIAKDMLTQIGDNYLVEVNNILAQLQKLQQISSGYFIKPAVIDENGMRVGEASVANIVSDFNRVPKYEHLLETLRNLCQKQKAVICVHYKESLRLLMKHLTQEGFNPRLIASSTDMSRYGRKVEQEKELFNGEDEGYPVLIGQLQSLKYGHGLYGTKERPALDIIYYENTYSLDTRRQSEQRLTRTGTSIEISDYICNRIDTEMINALARKQKLSTEVVNIMNER